jgi:hypothetical protein
MPRPLQALAKRLGAFYEAGAWRFPTVDAMREFLRLANQAGWIVE